MISFFYKKSLNNACQSQNFCLYLILTTIIYVKSLISIKMNEESLKNQLKAADEKGLVTIIEQVTKDVSDGRYRKVEVQHDVVTVLSQKRPRVNSKTRKAYQQFLYQVMGAASKNLDVMKKIRLFSKDNNLEIDC